MIHIVTTKKPKSVQIPFKIFETVEKSNVNINGELQDEANAKGSKEVIISGLRRSLAAEVAPTSLLPFTKVQTTRDLLRTHRRTQFTVNRKPMRRIESVTSFLAGDPLNGRSCISVYVTV
jgi:hypothetical protein